MKQNETNLAEYKNGLTPLQEKIAIFLASGKQVTEAANELQVSRATIYRLFQDVVFMAYYDLLCNEIKINTKNNLLSLQGKAFEAINTALSSSNDLVKLKAATWLIEKIQGIEIGVTNPTSALKKQCYEFQEIGFNERKLEILKKEYGL